MTEYDGFRVARDAERGIATITLDVPGKLNRVAESQLNSAHHKLAGLYREQGDEAQAKRHEQLLTGAAAKQASMEVYRATERAMLQGMPPQMRAMYEQSQALVRRLQDPNAPGRGSDPITGLMHADERKQAGDRQGELAALERSGGAMLETSERFLAVGAQEEGSASFVTNLDVVAAKANTLARDGIEPLRSNALALQLVEARKGMLYEAKAFQVPSEGEPLRRWRIVRARRGYHSRRFLQAYGERPYDSCDDLDPEGHALHEFEAVRCVLARDVVNDRIVLGHVGRFFLQSRAEAEREGARAVQDQALQCIGLVLSLADLALPLPQSR